MHNARMSNDDKGRRVTFWCATPGLWERLKAACEAENVSASSVLTKMIERHVRRKEAKS